jgi:transcriptional regulator with GAF, ATPase, and Fis domain
VEATQVSSFLCLPPDGGSGIVKRMRAEGKSNRLRPVEGEAIATGLVRIQHRIAACSSLEQLLAVIADDLGALLPVRDRVSLAFLEPCGEWMRFYRLLPPLELPPGELPRVRVEGTPVGRVVREGVGRLVADVRADPKITFGHASKDRIRSTLSVPVRIGGEVVGSLNAGSYTAGACREEMLADLADVAVAIAPAILAAESRLRMPRELAAPVPEPEPEPEPARDGPVDKLVGRSPAFRFLLGLAKRAARSEAEILITGETGVGKTGSVRAMHDWSARRGGPLITVHLADLSPTLVESELFGHERGAFTGASSHRVGRFEAAHGGTIFLDEIGEIAPALQSKLLRVIQDRCFERVGGEATMRVDIRIIAATSRKLRELVRRGAFREDLYYRLNVVPLEVPPLRERLEDLDPLIDSILARLSAAQGRRLTLTPAARARLLDHPFPGNIRELESVLRRAVILEERDELELAYFPDPQASPENALDTPEDAAWPTLEEHQRRYIEQTLERVNSVIEGPRGAAHLLGLPPSTLRSRMRRLKINA